MIRTALNRQKRFKKLIEDPKGYGYVDISSEILPELAGDRIFLSSTWMQKKAKRPKK
ncbi:hypothetical protein ACFTAO_45195 [Paenibacillus rhizoplanae]